jgi:broad specificity phosphatase PhoE
MTDTLLFIRHGETDLAGRFCGSSDPPINEDGFRQIEELIERLRTEPIDAVYASDLLRSLTTADAIGKAFALSPTKVPELREIDFGDWEGLSWHEIESRDPAYARQWSESYPNLPAPGGERFEAFRSRVLCAVKRLLVLSSQTECAAIVTHGGVMRVVLRSLCGLDEQEAWARTSAYCGVFRYQAGTLV